MQKTSGFFCLRDQFFIGEFKLINECKFKLVLAFTNLRPFYIYPIYCW